MTTASLSRRVVRLEQKNPEPGGIAHLSYEENHEACLIIFRQIAGKATDADNARLEELTGAARRAQGYRGVRTESAAAATDLVSEKEVDMLLRQAVGTDPEAREILGEEMVRALFGEEDAIY